MKLKKIIKNFDMIANVVIFQLDAYIDKKEEEKIYEGTIMDIPWYITNMYIDNDDAGEGIGVFENKFVIYVRESKEDK